MIGRIGNVRGRGTGRICNTLLQQQLSLYHNRYQYNNYKNYRTTIITCSNSSSCSRSYFLGNGFRTESEHKSSSAYGIPSSYRTKVKNRNNNYNNMKNDIMMKNETLGGNKSASRRSIRSTKKTKKSFKRRSSVIVPIPVQKIQQSKSTTTSISSKTSRFTKNNHTSSEKKIQNLLEMDHQLRNQIQNYQDKLQFDIVLDPSHFLDINYSIIMPKNCNNNHNNNIANYIPTSTTTNNNHNNNTNNNLNFLRHISSYHDNIYKASKLIETENDYINICLVLKHLLNKSLSFKDTYTSTSSLHPHYNNNNNITALESALTYVMIWESLRKQRDVFYNKVLLDSQEKKDLNISGLIEKWVVNTVSRVLDNTSDDGNDKNKVLSLQQLHAHKSKEYVLCRPTYAILMKRFITSNGGTNHSNYTKRRSKKNKITKKQGERVTLGYLESIVTLMKRSADYGNLHCLPNRSINHLLMTQYQSIPTMENSVRCVELLEEMIDMKKEGRYDSTFWPDRHTLNIVIQLLRLTVQQSETTKEKLKLISLAEHVLSTYHSNMNDLNVEQDPVQLSYYNVLQLICQNSIIISDFLERIDKLMIDMIGEENYRILCADNNQDLMQLHPKVFEPILHSFSASDNRDYVERAKNILKKMERMRNKKVVLNNEMIPWDDKFPDIEMYNTLIQGLFKASVQKDDNESDSTYQHRIKTNALFATRLLDNMMKNESSVPTPVTYYRILRLLSQYKSKETGEIGEVILSKMNVQRSTSSNKTQFDSHYFNIHQMAIDCWHASTYAKCAGVPRKVSKMLDQMNALYDNDQCNIDDNETSNFDNSRKVFVYKSALECCADTTVEADKIDALKVAFEIYKKLQNEKCVLSPHIFVILMKCCQFAHIEDIQFSLSKKVFNDACIEGQVSKYVLQTLKEVNYKLFQSYKLETEHAANVKDRKTKL